MTGWFVVAATGLLVAGTTVLAIRSEGRRRQQAAEERATEAARARIRAAVMAIVEKPWPDEFGVVRCTRCGGWRSLPVTKAHGKGEAGQQCQCDLQVAA